MSKNQQLATVVMNKFKMQNVVSSSCVYMPQLYNGHAYIAIFNLLANENHLNYKSSIELLLLIFSIIE